jgi:hypothetical protein
VCVWGGGGLEGSFDAHFRVFSTCIVIVFSHCNVLFSATVYMWYLDHGGMPPVGPFNADGRVEHQFI